MSTVTSLVNSLEDKGMLERVENELDRRRYDLVMQPQALEYVKAFMEFRVNLSKILFAVADKKTTDVVKQFFVGIKEFSIQHLETYES
jgi:DNA-binding MarR family transcriptional regulator